MRDSCQGLNFLADTGSEEDLISKSDCRAHFPDVPVGPSSRPVSLITANGPVKGNQSVKLEVPEISSTPDSYVPGINSSCMLRWKALHGRGI